MFINLLQATLWYADPPENLRVCM